MKVFKPTAMMITWPWWVRTGAEHNPITSCSVNFVPEILWCLTIRIPMNSWTIHITRQRSNQIKSIICSIFLAWILFAAILVHLKPRFSTEGLGYFECTLSFTLPIAGYKPLSKNDCGIFRSPGFRAMNELGIEITFSMVIVFHRFHFEFQKLTFGTTTCWWSITVVASYYYCSANLFPCHFVSAGKLFRKTMRYSACQQQLIWRGSGQKHSCWQWRLCHDRTRWIVNF